MNLKTKFSTVIVLTLLLLPLLSYLIKPSDITTTNTQFNIKPTPKSSGYWTLGPIHIEAESGIGAAYTWAEAVAEDWCSGDGSLLTPYLLENITIDAGGNNDALLIENSNGKYFTIRNCTLMNAGTNLMGNAGIKLDSSSNGTLENNFCLNNIKYGIIIKDGSNYNSIRNNFIYNSSHGGIRFDASNHNNVTSNEIIMGGDMFSTGVYISTSSSYNRVFHNNISDMRDGIEIFSDCHNNTISNNFINSILYDGISIASGASNNTFVMNKINNTDVGFWMMGDGSLVYNNFMTNSDQNAYDYGQYNRWDNGSLGNYWDDYGGSDRDDNGIGDTAYAIIGSANSYDNFPIWDDGDDPPIISIISPSINSYHSNPPTIQVSITDSSGVNETWYTIIGSGSNHSFTGVSFEVDMTSWMDELDGSVTIRIYANDTFSHLEFSDISLNKDTINPQIVINEPLGGTEFGEDPPTINISITELHVDQFWFTINDSTTKYFVSMISGDNVYVMTSIVWDAVPDGHVLLSLYMNDTAGNLGNISVTFNKDTSTGSTEPPAIPGFELGFMILVISASTMIIVIKRKKFPK